MPTTVVHSIGTSSRDFSTIQAWEDAAPADLTTADQIWRGECYNDAEFVSGSPLCTFAGTTSDATRYKELTAAAGQSFQDQAGVRTNALTYDVTKGVALRYTGSYVMTLDAQDQFVHVSRLQIAADGSQASLIGNSNTGAAGNGLFKDLVCTGRGGGTFVPGMWFSGGTIVNLSYILQVTPPSVAFRSDHSLVIGCTIAKTTDVGAAGVGLNATYGSPNAILESCAIFGFATPTNGAGWDTTNSQHNATDAASGLSGSVGNQFNVTYSATTPFTQAGLTGNDFRPIAGTALAANGFLNAGVVPNDISGTQRGAIPTIGAWELASAPATPARLIFQHA
jgi:hypothetical protein